MPPVAINRRESSALINSLTAGVVPRIGLRHIAVGRQNEVNAFLHDLSTIEDGGASFRLVSGQYGSGKSFLLQMIRNNAMERAFVLRTPIYRLNADLQAQRGKDWQLIESLCSIYPPAQGRKAGPWKRFYKSGSVGCK